MKDFCKDFTNADPKEANEVVKSDKSVGQQKHLVLLLQVDTLTLLGRLKREEAFSTSVL